MSAELYGDHDYYFPREGAVVKIPYAVGLSQQTEGPADTVTSAQARLYRHHTENEPLRTYDLRLIGEHELELDISAFVPAEDSPLIVEFVFEKEYRAPGPKRGSVETQTANVILALAEPAVGELVAEPEVLRAGEQAEIRVSKWAALTYDEPGSGRLDVEHDEPAIAERFPLDYPERVQWTVHVGPDGPHDAGNGTGQEHVWAAEDDGCTVVYQATIGVQPDPPEARVHGAATCFELVFRDAADPSKLLPLPAGLPAVIRYDDGSEQRAAVREGGILAAELDRTRPSFTLELAPGPKRYHVGLDPEQGATLLVEDGEESDLWRAGWRTFRLPPFTLDQVQVSASIPDGEVPFDPGSGRFDELDDLDRSYGTADAPILLVFEPRWHYLRFVYFDRWLDQTLSVPVRSVDEALPLVPRGLVHGEEHALAFWPVITQGEERAVWAVPWWTPVPRTGLRFGWPGSQAFVRAEDDGGRRLVYLSDDEALAPGVERLRHYDLPRRWDAAGMRAVLGERSGTFAQLGGEVTSPDGPLTFDLDDLVLTDEALRPLAWTRPPNVSLFHHLFRDGAELEREDVGSEGLYRPDPRPGRSRFSDVDATRNYFHTRPDWTRLVIADGAVFDVFADRVPEGVGGPVGARAAARLLDPAAPTDGVRDSLTRDRRSDGVPHGGRLLAPSAPVARPFAVAQRDVVHDQPASAEPDRAERRGRYDAVLLRCCDRWEADAGAAELGVVLRVLRWAFTFPSTPRGTSREEWVDGALTNVQRVWNPDYPLSVFVGEPHVRWECLTLAVPVGPRRSHYRIEVARDLSEGDVLRAERGLGRWDPDLARPEQAHAAARLAGHALGLPDEHEPGSPFHPDDAPGDAGLMGGGDGLRARYAWPAAEWVRAQVGRQVAVSFPDHGPHWLPPHRDPARTYGWWPAADALLGRGARAELTLLGRDQAAPHDGDGGWTQGVLRILLRLRCEGFPRPGSGGPTLPAAARARWAREALLGRLRGQVAADTDGRFVLEGLLKVGGVPWPLKPCALRVVLLFTSDAADPLLRFERGEAPELRDEGDVLTLVYRDLEDVGQGARRLVPALLGIEGKTTRTLEASDLLSIAQRVVPGAEVHEAVRV